MLPFPAKTNPKTLPREIAEREDEKEETSEEEGAKVHICSASVVERLGTHQISVGLHGTPSKTNITRRFTSILVIFLLVMFVFDGVPRSPTLI